MYTFCLRWEMRTGATQENVWMQKSSPTAAMDDAGAAVAGYVPLHIEQLGESGTFGGLGRATERDDCVCHAAGGDGGGGTTLAPVGQLVMNRWGGLTAWAESRG